MKRGAQLREALFIGAMVVVASVLSIWAPGLGVVVAVAGLIGFVVLAVVLVALRFRRSRRTVSFVHVPAADPTQQTVVAGMHYPEHTNLDPQFHYEWQLNSNAGGNVVGALHHHEADLVGAELARSQHGHLWAKCQCGAETGVPDRLGTTGARE